jgi:hypothetical protein
MHAHAAAAWRVMVRARARSLAPQVLFKMLNRGVFSEIYGCVSTGAPRAMPACV